ncbi:Rieske (2Fe-2S) protein [Salegentibacter flavus]|uniref:Ferredoxin subunit of nitrite reductase or a ring-hydroxylating dioxygenase n=1 Tax=Salegentibacter flavus TaxID=287099 RepID=A0A1I4XME0_9FLAO|nr:hypothetical protein [Salegentibacter flavus]SFN26450.1 hypothetical protein SAMN05660413_00127 [Salegentibacter flavus]
MKKIIFGLIIPVFLVGCSTDDNNRLNNPNLPDLNFRIQLNLDLPEYNNLQYPGNSYSTYSNGIKGVVVYNINNSQYTAFELSDPNHPPNNCSAMQVTGITAKCQCDDGNEYNIVTGELTAGEGQYTLKPYRIERRGNAIEVYN